MTENCKKAKIERGEYPEPSYAQLKARVRWLDTENRLLESEAETAGGDLATVRGERDEFKASNEFLRADFIRVKGILENMEEDFDAVRQENSHLKELLQMDNNLPDNDLD